MPPAVETLNPASLAEEIAFRLQCDILDGRIGLGERLAQDELCARFGVSRTPIREALMKLDAVNLVSLRPNRGAIVRVPSRREVQDAYQLRAELEGFAVELASGRLDANRLLTLRRAQRDLERVVADVDPETLGAEAESALSRGVAAANDAFHDAILEAAGNRALVDTVARLRGFFPKDYVTRALVDVNELRELNLDQHEQVLEALVAEEGARGRRAMSQHVAHAGEMLLAHLDRRHFWE